jgi:Taurine catabolism dioxygenase TauD, TfdA family
MPLPTTGRVCLTCLTAIGYTASDFPKARLGQKELEKFISKTGMAKTRRLTEAQNMDDNKVIFNTEQTEPGMPVIWNVVGGRNAEREEIGDALASNRSEIDAALYQHGGLLVRGFDHLRDAEGFEHVILKVTPALRDYVGGTSPRLVVQGKVMTATYVPPSWSIPLHQEMAYTRNPPDRITFFCEQPATFGGGHSTIGDMRLALDKIDPGIRRKFDRHGLQLRRTLPSHQTLQLKPGVQKPWSEVFGVDDPRIVDEIVASRGWRAEWRNGDTLEMWQDILPAIKPHPVTGEAVWCNQAHFFAPACMMSWAQEDGRYTDSDAIAKARAANPEMLDDIFFGNGEPVPDGDALHVYRVLRALERPIQLMKGDLLMLDNLILAHGRTAFAGERRVLVVLADN